MITNKCTICEKKTTTKYCSDACKAKAWRMRNPDRAKEVRKKHYDTHKEEILQRDRDKYWSGGKQKANKWSKDWYKKNKEKRSEYTKKYRQNRKELFDKYKDLERFSGNKQKVLDRDGNKCRLCFISETLQIHHIDGTGGNSRKGYENVNNSVKNLITLCKSCHIRTHRYEQGIMKRFQSIDDIVRTMPKVIEMYRNIHSLRKKS